MKTIRDCRARARKRIQAEIQSGSRPLAVQLGSRLPPEGDACSGVERPPAAFPLMTQPQPDTAERTRLAVQAIPFAIPEKRVEMHWDDIAPLYLQSYRMLGVGQAARWKPIPMPEVVRLAHELEIDTSQTLPGKKADA